MKSFLNSRHFYAAGVAINLMILMEASRFESAWDWALALLSIMAIFILLFAYGYWCRTQEFSKLFKRWAELHTEVQHWNDFVQQTQATGLHTAKPYQLKRTGEE